MESKPNKSNWNRKRWDNYRKILVWNNQEVNQVSMGRTTSKLTHQEWPINLEYRAISRTVKAASRVA